MMRAITSRRVQMEGMPRIATRRRFLQAAAMLAEPAARAACRGAPAPTAAPPAQKPADQSPAAAAKPADQSPAAAKPADAAKPAAAPPVPTGLKEVARNRTLKYLGQ